MFASLVSSIITALGGLVGWPVALAEKQRRLIDFMNQFSTMADLVATYSNESEKTGLNSVAQKLSQLSTTHAAQVANIVAAGGADAFMRVETLVDDMEKRLVKIVDEVDATEKQIVKRGGSVPGYVKPHLPPAPPTLLGSLTTIGLWVVGGYVAWRLFDHYVLSGAKKNSAYPRNELPGYVKRRLRR